MENVMTERKTKIIVQDAYEKWALLNHLDELGYHWISGQIASEGCRLLLAPVVLVLNEANNQLSWTAPSVYDTEEQLEKFFEDVKEIQDVFPELTKQIAIVKENEQMSVLLKHKQMEAISSLMSDDLEPDLEPDIEMR